MANEPIQIVWPLPEQNRVQAAALYWQAFGAKLGRVMGPEPRALGYIERVLNPAHGIGAISKGGSLLGLAGFKTDHGALVGGGLPELTAIYGRIGALWRATVLSLLERPVQADTLLMDGISVKAEARGTGIGSLLLDYVKSRARQMGKRWVRLDVIDSNPRARALYERHGFVAAETESLGPFAPVFGFRTATQMRFDTYSPLSDPGSDPDQRHEH